MIFPLYMEILESAFMQVQMYPNIVPCRCLLRRCESGIQFQVSHGLKSELCRAQTFYFL